MPCQTCRFPDLTYNHSLDSDCKIGVIQLSSRLEHAWKVQQDGHEEIAWRAVAVEVHKILIERDMLTR